MTPRIHIGTSGWSYKHWSDPVFYPRKLKVRQWLSYYCRHFDSVEINTTFYRLPNRKAFEQWYQETPPHFIFTVKGSQFITHRKKLADPKPHTSRFLSQVAILGEKLGVVLFQLPPYWKFNPVRLGVFLDYLRCQTIIPVLRVALEIRHLSWYCEECFTILRQFGIALVYADWPTLSVESPGTANFIFIRHHGPGDLYASSYSNAELKKDACRIRSWMVEGKDVYVYFNNDANGFAVKNALELKQMTVKN